MTGAPWRAAPWAGTALADTLNPYEPYVPPPSGQATPPAAGRDIRQEATHDQKETAPAADSTPWQKAGENSAPLKKDVGSQVFFDARSTAMNRNLNKEIFEGDVVAIGAGTLIAADKVTYDRAASLVTADGHIVVLTKNQVFTGDSITYHLDTGDFEITHSLMLSNDQGEIDRVTQRVFGFTQKELVFETARKQRLAALEDERTRLRRDAERASRAGKPLADAFVERYAQILDEEKAINGQMNPALAHLPEEKRDAFERRRAFWEASQKSVLAKARGGPLSTAYFHIDGDTITRVNGNDYTARNALFTPCHCEPGESPAWAFHADEIDAQVGGYADMDQAVLEIKGVPVLYLPRLSVPLKDKRQSGFLMPVAGYEQRSGNTFTEPLYFDLGPDRDATVTTDVYQNRGTRLGLEYRTEERQSTGWQMKVEAMRDELWLSDIGDRKEIAGMYKDGYNQALADYQDGKIERQLDPDLSDEEYTRQRLADPAYWNLNSAYPSTDATGQASSPSKGNMAANQGTFNNTVANQLVTPDNTWRGAFNWSGVSYLAPRLSFVSNGAVTSDHRYTEELYVPDDYQDALYGHQPAKAISTAKGQLNLDGKDYYLGVGSRYGDYYLSQDRFQGQQIPTDLKAQSRLFALAPESSPIPVYGEVQAENIRISEFKSVSPVPVTPPQPTLGDGSWRRAKFSEVAPLVTDRIVQVHQFADLEGRSIEHDGLAQHASQIQSWHTGVEFRLPIDGKGELPEFMQGDDCLKQTPRPPGCLDPSDPDAPRKYVHHLMNWSLRLATRPMVYRRGLYDTMPDGSPAPLSYFASDLPPPGQNATVDPDIKDEDRMGPQQRITLSTDQVWRLFRRAWTVVPGTAPAPAAGPSAEDSRAQARRELSYSLDRQATDASQIYDDKTNTFLVDRYQRSDTYYEDPVNFHADIAYDVLDEKTRKAQEDQNDQIEAANAAAKARGSNTETPLIPLDEPWRDANLSLGINHAGWALSAAAAYAIYLHAARTESLGLTFPTVFDSTLSAGYSLSKQPNGGQLLNTVTRALTLSTSLIKPVTSFISLSRQETQGQPYTYDTDFREAIGFEYNSSSQCWGFRFARTKDIGYDERNASYVAQLTVTLMGQTRPLPDMSGGVVRESQSERSL